MSPIEVQPAKLTFAGIPDETALYASSRYVIIPAGYDRTTSYGSGARRGPQAILDASMQVELFDEELERNTFEDGIFLSAPLESPAQGPQSIVHSVHRVASQVLLDGKIPVVLGGEHTVSLGSIQACKERCGELTVVQIDAHADLRDEYEGTPYSHACVMRRASEMGCHLIQLGIRSLSQEEMTWLRQHPDHSKLIYARDLAGKIEADRLQELFERIREPVYLTIDLDGLDPSIMPATGTPEPGGFSWYETLQLLRVLTRLTTIIGFDIVELAPLAGIHAPDFLAARLLYRLMGYISTPGDHRSPHSAV